MSERESGMRNLWAPWRMSYILGEDKAAGCIFCLAGDGRGADDLVLGVGPPVWHDEQVPYNNGLASWWLPSATADWRS